MTRIKSIRKNDILSLISKNIYIFGAGEYARDVSEGLKREGLCVKSLVVDDVYLLDTQRKDIQVISLSSFREEMQPEDVLINGVSNVKRFRQMIYDGFFDVIYLWYEPHFIWNYDESFWYNRKNELDDTCLL